MGIAICCRTPGGACFEETKEKNVETKTMKRRPRMVDALELATEKEDHNPLVPVVGNLAV